MVDISELEEKAKICFEQQKIFDNLYFEVFGLIRLYADYKAIQYEYENKIALCQKMIESSKNKRNAKYEILLKNYQKKQKRAQESETALMPRAKKTIDAIASISKKMDFDLTIESSLPTNQDVIDMLKKSYEEVDNSFMSIYWQLNLVDTIGTMNHKMVVKAQEVLEYVDRIKQIEKELAKIEKKYHALVKRYDNSKDENAVFNDISHYDRVLSQAKGNEIEQLAHMIICTSSEIAKLNAKCGWPKRDGRDIYGDLSNNNTASAINSLETYLSSTVRLFEKAFGKAKEKNYSYYKCMF